MKSNTYIRTKILNKRYTVDWDSVKVLNKIMADLENDDDSDCGK